MLAKHLVPINYIRVVYNLNQKKIHFVYRNY